MSLENLLAARDIAIKAYDTALKSLSNDTDATDSDAAGPILDQLDQLTELKKNAIAAASSYSEKLDETNASDNAKIKARDLMRNLSGGGGRRRRSSTPRKTSSSRRRRSTKRRTASHKQQKRRRGSRRAH